MADPLSPERWSRVSGLLDRALELEPSTRSAFLDREPGLDAELRVEVEELLAACEAAKGFLNAPAAEFASALVLEGEARPPELAAGERVGPFRVVRELARGGMGAVYLAERDDPQLRQRVAIKRVRGGLASAQLIRRFVEERQILASLDHPGIARLLDGAVSADGVPWFAMEYVEGDPLDRYCDQRRLTIEARLELFIQVCDAVQYAHRSLVVHRDLKPGNILVTADGHPKLLDFGIARMLSADPSGAGGGIQLLTPQYASPEQRRGEPGTTAADVYALGAILHRLLTGRLPGAEPPTASAAWEQGDTGPALAEAAAARRLTPHALQRALRVDLDAIVRQAMHPEPERRYASAQQLAADLRRHLRLLPVEARASTRGYRTGRFIRRNRWGAAAAVLTAALIIGFGISSRVQALRVATERDRAEQVEGFLLGLLYGADLYAGSGRAVTVRELLDRGAAQLAGGEVRRPEARARLFHALGSAYSAMGEYDSALALMDSAYRLEQQLHGPAHPRAIAIANRLADVLRLAGRYDAARELYRVILDARRTEADPTSLARSLNGLAMVIRMQGRYGEAEALLREALAIDRARAEAEPAALTQTLNNLGHVLREQGRLAEAEALHSESLAARRALWGPDHFEVSVSLANLAGVLRDRGDWAGADSLYQQGLQLRERLVGDAHPDLASDRAGYALLRHHRGEAAAAESLYRQALAVHRRAYPDRHPATATTMLGLGDLLVDLGRAEEAEPLLREALAARQSELPRGHWKIAEAESALGAGLSRLGRHAEAEPLLTAAIPVLERRAPAAADPYTAAAYRRLASHRARSESPGSRTESPGMDPGGPLARHR